MSYQITETPSEFNSPTYNVSKISIFDIVSQSANPNSMSSKSFAALQTSVFNTGYTFPILIVANPLYEEKNEDLSPIKRINAVIEGGSDDTVKSGVGGDTIYSTQVSDEEIRSFFKYQVVDGQQRSSVIRLGTKFFMDAGDKAQALAAKWSNGEDIPNDPGKEMLMYLAWRENFTIPCVVLYDYNDVSLMSITVLMNQARGTHGLDSMKDIVYNLINVAGMSREWVSRNLFLDIEAINRMSQLSGLKSAYDNMDNASLGWNPVTDNSYRRKMDAYLNREAAKYVKEYLADHPDTDSGAQKDMGDIKDFAETLGWNRENAEKIRQSGLETAPNGSRREGSIHNNYQG